MSSDLLRAAAGARTRYQAFLEENKKTKVGQSRVIFKHISV